VEPPEDPAWGLGAFHLAAEIGLREPLLHLRDRQGGGPAFLKVCGDAPYALKLCLNGHEWAKRQLQRRRLRFTALDNGLLDCANPAAVQAVCERLTDGDIAAFFERWLAQVPLPLAREHRAAGFAYQLSIRQMEVSRPQVFDRPARGREFFEEILRDHLDLGRPSRLQLWFPRKITRATPGRFSTRGVTQGVIPSLHLEYQRCHLKQYFKEGRALRTETTFNDTHDFGVGRGLRNFGYLRTLGQHINTRLLETEQVAHDGGLAARRLGTTLDLVHRVLAQTRARILRGETHYPDKVRLVLDLARLALIDEARGHTFGQRELGIEALQQHRPAVRTGMRLGEAGGDRLRFGLESERDLRYTSVAIEFRVGVRNSVSTPLFSHTLERLGGCFISSFREFSRLGYSMLLQREDTVQNLHRIAFARALRDVPHDRQPVALPALHREKRAERCAAPVRGLGGRPHLARAQPAGPDRDLHGGLFPDHASATWRTGASDSFALYLCAGLLPWVAFADCVTRGASVFLEKATYLKKLPIPEQVFVARNAVAAPPSSPCRWPCSGLVTLVMGGRLTTAWLAVPPVLVLLQGFGFGLGLIFSTLNVFVRDTGHALTIALQIWMWMTPIVWVESVVPLWLGTLIPWNPAYPFIDALHRMIVAGTWPPLGQWPLMAAWVAGASGAGYLLLRRLRPEIRGAL
jgi:ABC-type polysaccharide/polyol phosphate export permease